MIFSEQYHEEINEADRECECRECRLKGSEWCISSEEGSEREKTRKEEESSDGKKQKYLMEDEIHCG